MFAASVQAFTALISSVCKPIAVLFYISRWVAFTTVNLVVTETCIIRLLSDWLWPGRFPPISDEFFAGFLVILNTFLALFASLLNLITGQNTDEIYRVQGKKSNQLVFSVKFIFQVCQF